MTLQSILNLFRKSGSADKMEPDPPPETPEAPIDTREERILKFIDPQKAGLEIGPSHSPIASKASGFDVRVLDYLDREGLVQKCRQDDIETARIEHVDYVWSGEPYAELIEDDVRFNWIISSHNIEHMPELIGFLNNCRDVLEVGGILSLAIPDYRYIFDTARSPTSLAPVIDAHFRNDTKPTAGAIAEFHLKYSRRGDLDSWTADSQVNDQPAVRANPASLAKSKYEKFLETGDYFDVHVWCFTPEIFVSLFEDLCSLSLLEGLELVEQPNTISGWEFFVYLRRTH